MADNFFAFHWCLCVSISFILFILFQKRTARNVMGEKNWKCALRCSPNSIFLRVDLVKMSSKKAGNVISGTLTWKISWRSMLPDPLSNFSSRRAYILQIWFGDQPQSSSIFYYFPPSMKNKRQVRHSLTHQKMPRHETATSLLIWWRGKGPTSLWVQKCKRTPTWLLLQKKWFMC